MTQVDKILLAAARIPAPFSREDLAVACWRCDPEAFGMRLYRHPSTQVVYAWLCHSRGPIKRGLIQDGPRLALTAAGRARVAELTGDGTPPPPEPTEAEQLWAASRGREQLRLRHAKEVFGLTDRDVLAGAGEKVWARLIALAADESPEGRARHTLADYLAGKFAKTLRLGEWRRGAAGKTPQPAPLNERKPS